MEGQNCIKFSFLFFCEGDSRIYRKRLEEEDFFSFSFWGGFNFSRRREVFIFSLLFGRGFWEADTRLIFYIFREASFFS